MKNEFKELFNSGKKLLKKVNAENIKKVTKRGIENIRTNDPLKKVAAKFFYLDSKKCTCDISKTKKPVNSIVLDSELSKGKSNGKEKK